MGKFIRETVHTEVDPETGEVTRYVQAKTFAVNSGKDPFYLTYVKFMGVLYGISSASTIKILWKFLEYAQYNTGIVYVTVQLKRQIISELGISQSIYMKGVKTLVSLGIISGSRGTYTINPEIFWKGDYRSREMLKEAGCSVTFSPCRKEK